MQILKAKLIELHKQKKFINVAVIGAGFMGNSLIVQLNELHGFKCNICYSRDNDKTKKAFLNSGANQKNIKYISKKSQYNKESNDFYIMEDPYEFFDHKDIDIIVDATGSPYEGAKIAFNALKNKKHVVSLNVECDVVIGPLLTKIAQDNGVTYTGIAGDEPGTVKELYDFAKMLGFEVLMIGKGKNNPLIHDADYESVYDEAMEKGIKPNMLASFVDGSKTMEELTLMCNATGFTPDVPGCHGVVSDIKNLEKELALKADGGVIEKYNTVEYVNGIAPGVFVLIRAQNEIVDHELKFLKIGIGPNYILYRPYHLTSLEVPITIAQSYFFNIPTIAPIALKPYADTVAVAKRDLHPGDVMDEAGGKTAYGIIYKYKDARENDYMPYGFIGDTVKIKKEIKKGTPIKYSDVEIEESKLFELRKILESLTK